MKFGPIIFFAFLILVACNKDKFANGKTGGQTILDQLAANYNQMQEEEVSISLDHSVYAQYAMPTEKYSHGILGDAIEAEQLVVVVDSVFYELKLSGEYVFEDIRPRLYDVDGDNELEVITIRTHVSQGGGIAIYKIVDEQLIEYATLPEIGTPYRWLNIVAINDLDYDGIVELVWIETPHIGGILKVTKVEPGTLGVMAEKAQYSNHAIGEKNLCLSVITEQLNKKVFYVPNQSRNMIVGFTFVNGDIQVFEEIAQEVDFSKSLYSQYGFSNISEDHINCINANK